MPSERIQRRIDRLLEAADEAVAHFDWEAVRENAQAALDLDPENSDAPALLAAAERALSRAASSGAAQVSQDAVSFPATEPKEETSPKHPTSFANGRYIVKRFLGEGGKKKVYLAHDTRLDRDVAFARIEGEG